MCAFMVGGVGMHVCWCMCKHTEARDQPFGIFLQVSSTFFIEQGLLVDFRLTDQGGLASLLVSLSDLLFSASQHWKYKRFYFTQVWNQTQVFMFARQSLY